MLASRLFVAAVMAAVLHISSAFSPAAFAPAGGSLPSMYGSMGRHISPRYPPLFAERMRKNGRAGRARPSGTTQLVALEFASPELVSSLEAAWADTDAPFICITHPEGCSSLKPQI